MTLLSLLVLDQLTDLSIKLLDVRLPVLLAVVQNLDDNKTTVHRFGQG